MSDKKFDEINHSDTESVLEVLFDISLAGYFPLKIDRHDDDPVKIFLGDRRQSGRENSRGRFREMMEDVFVVKIGNKKVGHITGGIHDWGIYRLKNFIFESRIYGGDVIVDIFARLVDFLHSVGVERVEVDVKNSDKKLLGLMASLTFFPVGQSERNRSTYIRMLKFKREKTRNVFEGRFCL